MNAERRWGAARPRTLALATLATLMATACSNEPAVACPVPSEAISGFEVTITTGSDASDADIFFWAERRSDGSRPETMLGNEGVDDWDEGSIETYVVSIPIAAGDLAGVALENRGDAPDLSFDGNDWELEGVRLRAVTATGGVVVFDEQNLGEYMTPGDTWRPTSCFF